MDKERPNPPARDSSCDSAHQPAEIVHQFPTGSSLHGSCPSSSSSSHHSESNATTTRPRGIFQMTIPLSSHSSQSPQLCTYSGDGPEFTKPVGGGGEGAGPSGQLFASVNASSSHEGALSTGGGGDDLTSQHMQATSNYLAMGDSQKTTGVIKVSVGMGNVRGF